ncbi:MAG: hypothetical protein WC044_02740 [Crocinitomicaceae bacterium]
MKQSILFFLIFPFSNLVGQNSNVQINRFAFVKGDPEIVHETDSFLYVDQVNLSGSYKHDHYMIKKSSLKQHKIFHLGYNILFSGSDILEIIMKKRTKQESREVIVYLHNFEKVGYIAKKVTLDLGDQIEKRFINLSKAVSPSGQFFLVSANANSSEDDKNLIQYFVLNENLEVVHRFEDYYLNTKDRIVSIDNDGSVYVLSNNNILTVYNALKNYEKWEQSFFPTNSNYSQGKFHEFKVVQQGTTMSFKCIYELNNYVVSLTIPIDYYTKEVNKIQEKDLPWASQYLNNGKILEYEYFSTFLTSYASSFTPIFSSKPRKTNILRFNSKSNAGSDMATVVVSTENSLFIPYAVFGSKIDSSALYMLFNVHKKDANKPEVYKNDSLTMDFHSKLKRTRKSVTLLCVIDLKTGALLKKEKVFTRLENKKYKAFPLPKTIWLSKDGKNIYFIATKPRLNPINQCIVKYTLHD